MEIDQLTVTSTSLTFRTKVFLDESDNLLSLDTIHIVFLCSMIVTESHSLSWGLIGDLHSVLTLGEYFRLNKDLV